MAPRRKPAPAKRKGKKADSRSWSISATLRKALHGQVISSDFFRRHWLPAVALLLLLLTYITSKYVCQTRMEQINALTKELEIVKAERIRVRSLYMGRTCESSMQQLVDTMHLGLTVADRPPYTLPTD